MREGHIREALAVLAAGSLVLIGWVLSAQPEGSWVALAAGIHALATVLLVAVAISLTAMVETQAEASRTSVDRLVRRDMERELRDLRAVHSALVGLADEARRWRVRDDLFRLARQGTLPDDALDPDALRRLRDGTSALRIDAQETVREAVRAARDARHSLGLLRRWSGGHATGDRTRDEIERLGRSLTDTEEHARRGAESVGDQARELEERIEGDGRRGV